MKKIHIEIVKAQELDPAKKYLIEIPSTSYTMEEARDLSKGLNNMDVNGLIVMRRGDELITISELPLAQGNF